MKKNRENMVITTVHFPRTWIEALDALVEAGFYANRAEAIRAAVRDLLVSESKILEKKAAITGYDRMWRLDYGHE